MTSPVAGRLSIRPSWPDSSASQALLPGRPDLSLDVHTEGHPTRGRAVLSGTEVRRTLRTITDQQDTSETRQLVFLGGILGQKRKGNIVGTVYYI